MLGMTPIQDARAAGAYYGKTDGGYYLDGTGLHREVGGQAAALLGLADRPDPEQFQRLLEGLHPLTGEKLTARRITTRVRSGGREERRVAGWDLTASVPKGVTEAIEAGDERVRAALWETVRETAADIEPLITTRVRKGRREEDRVTSNMVWYAFEHPETRPVAPAEGHGHSPTEAGQWAGQAMPDPDRHIHVVVPSVTFDAEEDQWKAIKWRPVVDLRKYFSHRFDLRLSARLADLGYQIETTHRPDGKGGRRYYSWDIAGMPETLIAKDSRRHREIDQLAGELGVTSPLTRGKLGATSRKAKRDDLTLSDCRAYWASKRTPEEARALAECVRRAVEGKNPRPEPAAEQAARYAVEHHFASRSVVRYADLEVTAMERMMGRGRPEDLADALHRLGVLRVGGEATTAELKGQEGAIIRFTRAGKGSRRPVVASPAELRPLLKAASAAAGVELTDQQENCLRGLVCSRDAVNVADAGQGTGKTEMLAQYGHVLAARGVRTTWLGTTHKAVEELTDRNLPAMTLAHFLASPAEQRQAAGSRIILDESSMLSHRDAYRLFMYAKASGCRIDLVGDSKQYRSPAAGAPMELLTRFAGVTPFTMTKTMRQSGRLKQAMELIRDGGRGVLQGHDLLVELGMVHQVSADGLTQRAADLYLEWTKVDRGQKKRWAKKSELVPVISPTHAQADEIAEKIRAGLRERGDLKGKERTARRLVNLNWSPAQMRDAREHGAGEGVVLTRYGAYREATQPLAVGDRVRTTMGGTAKDGRTIRSGRKFQITGFTKSGDPVLTGGITVDKNWGGLVQDYVRTGQGWQGATAKRAIVAYGTPSLVATREEGFYVPVSRVKQEVVVLCDDPAALREAIQRREVRKTATELLAAPPRPPAPQRQRLGRHLAYLRRLAEFSWAHEPRAGERQKTPNLEREASYVR